MCSEADQLSVVIGQSEKYNYDMHMHELILLSIVMRKKPRIGEFYLVRIVIAPVRTEP